MQGLSEPRLEQLDLVRPTREELAAVANRFGLDPRAVDDAVAGHQRSKLERYGETLLVVLRTARYDESAQRVVFSEVDIFVRPEALVTIRHAGPKPRIDPRISPEAALYGILDEVVDSYAPVVSRLETAVDRLEDQILRGEPEVSRRIYELLGQVVEFERAVHPLRDMLERLHRGSAKYDVDLELRNDLRHVIEHVMRVIERVDSFRMLLQNALTLHSTIVTQQQNDEMRALSEASLAQNEETRMLTETSLAQSEGVKKISAWAAIFFGPTLIATIYGMNFDVMPELHWKYGYPVAVGLMLAAGGALYVLFRRKKWL